MRASGAGAGGVLWPILFELSRCRVSESCTSSPTTARSGRECQRQRQSDALPCTTPTPPALRAPRRRPAAHGALWALWVGVVGVCQRLGARLRRAQCRGRPRHAGHASGTSRERFIGLYSSQREILQHAGMQLLVLARATGAVRPGKSRHLSRGLANAETFPPKKPVVMSGDLTLVPLTYTAFRL